MQNLLNVEKNNDSEAKNKVEILDSGTALQADLF